MKSRPYYPEFEAGNLLRVRSSFEDMPKVPSDEAVAWQRKDGWVTRNREEEIKEYWKKKKWEDFISRMRQKQGKTTVGKTIAMEGNV